MYYLFVIQRNIILLLLYDFYYRVDSINGTAKEGEDYVKVKEIVVFKENEEEKEV